MIATAVAGVAVGAAPATQGLQGPALPAADRRLVACAAAQLFSGERPFADERRPLLVVNGQRAGRVSPPVGACPSSPRLPGNAREIRYVKQAAAIKVWGPDGKDGAVVIDMDDP